MISSKIIRAQVVAALERFQQNGDSRQSSNNKSKTKSTLAILPGESRITSLSEIPNITFPQVAVASHGANSSWKAKREISRKPVHRPEEQCSRKRLSQMNSCFFNAESATPLKPCAPPPKQAADSRHASPSSPSSKAQRPRDRRRTRSSCPSPTPHRPSRRLP